MRAFDIKLNNNKTHTRAHLLFSNTTTIMLKARFFRTFGRTAGSHVRGLASASSSSAASASAIGSASTPASAAEESIDQLSHREDWMVNLNRECDNWLVGPRSDEWYTGKRPVFGECPGVLEDGTFTSLALPRLDRVTREETQAYFDNTWTSYEILFAGLKGEEYFYRPPPHGLRHPQIFYYGHTPCLYVNKLQVAGVLDKGVNPYFESIYETGVDEMLWDDMHKNDMVWPTVKETHEYRKEVYQVVSDVIATHPDIGTEGSPSTITWDHPLWALFMGFEHDRIHFETSSVLFREAPESLVQVPKEFPKLHPSARDATRKTHAPVRGEHYPAQNRFIAVQGGDVTLGKPRKFPSYGWDNEYGTRDVTTPSFHATEYMVTNGDFFEFVKAGGYRTEKYWTEDGWGWRKFRNMKDPHFWEWDGPQGSFKFKLRTIFETIDMQWDWPAEVTHHEAKAYCAWKSEQDGASYRLPTEAEWNLLKDPAVSLERARGDAMADPVMSMSGKDFVRDPSSPKSANLNLAYGSASPVGGVGAPSQSGHYDVMGNVWEHMEDNFNPLEEGLVSYVGGSHLCNYEIHPTYDDFSVPCYDGRHDMILGGSFMSTGDEASTFARFHFRRHFLQHSGFRMVKSDSAAPAAYLNEAGEKVDADGEPLSKTEQTITEGERKESNVYETQSLVDQYLGLHYSSCSGKKENIPFMMAHEGLPAGTGRFPQRVAELLFQLDGQHNKSYGASSTTRALDLGCAVGGTSYTLATRYDEVVGIDFSQAFVDAANSMKGNEDIHFNIAMEADVHARVLACHEDGVDAAAKARTKFLQGDACNLDEKELGQFDSIVMANLICRLPRPMDCLDSLSRMVKPGGMVVMTTPFSWLEEFTNREQWMGGYYDESTGEPVDSAATLLREMEARGFKRLYKEPIPLVIREHQRKYQYIVADATGWQKL